MIEVLSVVLSPGADHGPNLASMKIVGAMPPTHVNQSSWSCPNEWSDVAPPIQQSADTVSSAEGLQIEAGALRSEGFGEYT